MKRLLLGAAAAMAVAGSAMAADMPPRTYTKAPVYTPPQAIYDWTGFYIGGHIGGAFADNNSGSLAFPGGGLITSKNDQIGSATGRFGYTWGPALLYAKGGFAWRDNPNIGVSVDGTPFAFTTEGTHKDGWTAGAGLEYMFAPNWSAKAEYQYYNFGNTTFTSGPAAVVGSRLRDDDHSVKVGVNYRFGWGGPVQPRY
jgi:outer membrane immunogenic protein